MEGRKKVNMDLISHKGKKGKVYEADCHENNEDTLCILQKAVYIINLQLKNLIKYVFFNITNTKTSYHFQLSF